MAEALQELYPGIKFGIGPAIENGFYYDVDPGTAVIKEADLPRANTLFLELGYRASGNSEAAMPIAKYHHLPPLLKKGEVPVGIELHWTLEKPSAGFNIDVAGLWRRARPAAFGNTNALALGMEDLLLHLCLHASYHHQFRFGFFLPCNIVESDFLICFYIALCPAFPKVEGTVIPLHLSHHRPDKH